MYNQKVFCFAHIFLTLKTKRADAVLRIAIGLYKNRSFKATKNLQKPRTFAEAQELEKECVLFAKVKCLVGTEQNF